MANFWLQETIYYIYFIQRDLLLNMLWYHHKNIHLCKYIARQSYGTTLRGQPFCLTTGGNVSQCQYKDLPIFKRALETLWETFMVDPLQWRQNEQDGVSNHQPHDCLLNRLLGRRSKKASKLRVTDLCAGNSPVTDEFPAQKASNAENVSIWWRHHDHVCPVLVSLLSQRADFPNYVVWCICVDNI